MNDQRFFDLAVKVIAEQATDAERSELGSLLVQEPEFRAEFERLEMDAHVAKDVLPLIASCTASTGEFPSYARERLQTAVRQTLGPRKFVAKETLRNWRWVVGLSIATAAVLLLALPVFRSTHIAETMYTREQPSKKTAEDKGVPNAAQAYAAAEASKHVGETASAAGRSNAAQAYAAVEASKHVGETASVPGRWNAAQAYAAAEASKHVGETASAAGRSNAAQAYAAAEASKHVGAIASAPGMSSNVAWAPPNYYTPEEAANHVGEMAIVTGKVDDFHQSAKGNIFLNMGGKYPNQAFRAWIPSASAQLLQPQQYQGQTISVSGKITLDQGKPEIEVTSLSQITTR